MDVQKRYGGLRFFAGLHVVLGWVVAAVGAITAFTAAGRGAPVVVALGAVLVGIALVATGQVFRVLMDIEENTRAIREQREAPAGPESRPA